jgi:hypothetical protein
MGPILLPELGGTVWSSRPAAAPATPSGWLADPRVSTMGARAIGQELITGRRSGGAIGFLVRRERRRTRWRTAER